MTTRVPLILTNTISTTSASTQSKTTKSNFLQHFKKAFRRPIRNKEEALTNYSAPGLELAARPWTSVKDDRSERRQTRVRALRATKPQPQLAEVKMDQVTGDRRFLARCAGCNQFGHTVEDCPNTGGAGTPGSVTPSSPTPVVVVSLCDVYERREMEISE